MPVIKKEKDHITSKQPSFWNQSRLPQQEPGLWPGSTKGSIGIGPMSQQGLHTYLLNWSFQVISNSHDNLKTKSAVCWAR